MNYRAEPELPTNVIWTFKVGDQARELINNHASRRSSEQIATLAEDLTVKDTRRVLQEMDAEIVHLAQLTQQIISAKKQLKTAILGTRPGTRGYLVEEGEDELDD